MGSHGCASLDVSWMAPAISGRRRNGWLLAIFTVKGCSAGAEHCCSGKCAPSQVLRTSAG
jgi:hypothetical protein